jgi:hypothetical protein
MLCPERQLLQAEYLAAAEQYSECVRDFLDAGKLSVNADVERVRMSCSRALAVYERARLALARHEADHSCDRPDFG